jgi:hypothetical protein
MERCAMSLRRIAGSIGRERPAPTSELRGLQRECARKLAADGRGPELIALTDRLVDNINTLGHVVERAQSVRDRGTASAMSTAA